MTDEECGLGPVELWHKRKVINTRVRITEGNTVGMAVGTLQSLLYLGSGILCGHDRISWAVNQPFAAAPCVVFLFSCRLFPAPASWPMLLRK